MKPHLSQECTCSACAEYTASIDAKCRAIEDKCMQAAAELRKCNIDIVGRMVYGLARSAGESDEAYVARCIDGYRKRLRSGITAGGVT